MIRTTIFLSRTIVISSTLSLSDTYLQVIQLCLKLAITRSLFISSLHLNLNFSSIIQQRALFHFRLSFMKLSSSRKFSHLHARLLYSQRYTRNLTRNQLHLHLTRITLQIIVTHQTSFLSRQSSSQFTHSHPTISIS